MYNLNFLEKETVADRNFIGLPIGTRLHLFKLFDVPKNVIEQMLFSNHTVEGETFESLRSFNSLPKWLKKRMKFRLKNMSLFPDLEHFVTNL